MRGGRKKRKPLGAFSKNRRRHPPRTTRKGLKATAAEIFSPWGPQSLKKVVFDHFRLVKYKVFEATRFQNTGLAAFFFKICSQTNVLEACCFKNPVFYESKVPPKTDFPRVVFCFFWRLFWWWLFWLWLFWVLVLVVSVVVLVVFVVFGLWLWLWLLSWSFARPACCNVKTIKS